MTTRQPVARASATARQFLRAYCTKKLGISVRGDAWPPGSSSRDTREVARKERRELNFSGIDDQLPGRNEKPQEQDRTAIDLQFHGGNRNAKWQFIVLGRLKAQQIA